ncbi:MAG: hypothetical protein M2R45_05150 [Verrucomicrobia subdivision 3 bacterium]|nr:hypothetical protein [Limisphaerales bacterium]MCS1413793.1 hypothetical protein [Limisphaerales bacterium]
MHRAKDVIIKFVLRRGDRNAIETMVTEVLVDTDAYLNEPLRGSFAKSLVGERA